MNKTEYSGHPNWRMSERRKKEKKMPKTRKREATKKNFFIIIFKEYKCGFGFLNNEQKLKKRLSSHSMHFA